MLKNNKRFKPTTYEVYVWDDKTFDEISRNYYPMHKYTIEEVMQMYDSVNNLTIGTVRYRNDLRRPRYIPVINQPTLYYAKENGSWYRYERGENDEEIKMYML